MTPTATVPASFADSPNFEHCLGLVNPSLDRVAEKLRKVLESHFELVCADKETASRTLVHFNRCVKYTVAGGKMTRGATVPLTLLSLQSNPSPDLLLVASDVGFCLEILQAAFLVLDDVMDNSVLRRGKPCWHLVPSIGVSNAVNDGLFLENAVFAIIRTLVPRDKRLAVLELINETVLRTLIGQNLDVNTHGVSEFHEERYRTIIKSKTSFYSFWLPVALGVSLSDVKVSEEELEKTREACIVLGEYFQIQDDYLDCFGSPEILGKVGTDIEEGKCTWLVVKAFQKGNAEQQAQLTIYFEKDERSPDEVCAVKAIYTELGLKELFVEEEKKMSEKAEEVIGRVQTLGLRHALQLLFARIHKRSK